MSNVDPCDSKLLHQIENELQLAIHQAEIGKPNPKEISKIKSGLEGLIRSKDIPENVKKSLGMVLNDLKKSPNELSLTDLHDAHAQIMKIRGKKNAT